MKKIYLVIEYARSKRIRGYILDISRSGMSIACERRVNKNVTLKITTEKDILSPLLGKVVCVISRKRKTYTYRIGIKFISLKREQRQRLEKFLNKINSRKAARLSFI